MTARPDFQGVKRISFWFDPATPRNSKGKDEVIAALAARKGITVQELKRMNIETHHISCDRKDGSPENLFVCVPDGKGRTAAMQHANLHNQLHAKNIFELKTGLVKFDREKKMYYLGEELEPIYRAAAQRLKQELDDTECRSIGERIASL